MPGGISECQAQNDFSLLYQYPSMRRGKVESETKVYLFNNFYISKEED